MQNGPQIPGRTCKDGEAEMAKETIRLRSADQEFQATRDTVAPGSARIVLQGGEPFFVQAIGSGAYRVTQADRNWRAVGIAQGDQHWIFIDGQVAVVQTEEASSRRAPKGTGGPQSLTAPMPATITKIMVTANQQVQKGETLLLLEAMKMELPIRAPAAGVVKNVHCKEGDIVQPESLLIEFE
jgi:biotin carboxyl carrier protein